MFASALEFVWIGLMLMLFGGVPAIFAFTNIGRTIFDVLDNASFGLRLFSTMFLVAAIGIAAHVCSYLWFHYSLMPAYESMWDYLGLHTYGSRVVAWFVASLISSIIIPSRFYGALAGLALGLALGTLFVTGPQDIFATNDPVAAHRKEMEDNHRAVLTSNEDFAKKIYIVEQSDLPRDVKARMIRQLNAQSTQALMDKYDEMDRIAEARHQQKLKEAGDKWLRGK